MPIRTLIAAPHEVDATWLAVGVFDGTSGPPSVLAPVRAGEIVTRLLESKDLGTSVGDTTPILGDTGLKAGSLLTFGLGDAAAFSAGGAFSAGVAVAKRLASKPRDKVAFVLPDTESPAEIAEALLEGLIVGTRGPDLRKSEPARHPFGELTLVVPPASSLKSEQLANITRRAEIIGSAINLARDLANTPPAEKSPGELASRAREVAAAAGLGVDVWDLERIEQERFGGLLGVAAGTAEPPAFVTLNYRHGGRLPTLALVGKGVTFDSGGLSLKPSASMEDMKSDMTGAAVVLATMVAIAKLGLPVNVSGYLALTENMTGGRAMKLGDVLTIRNGKTVEVLNTDAEGRLILADALSYAVEQQPARILDLATLTGACVVALGQKLAGLFSNDDPFAADLESACRRTGERVWRMPLVDEYDDLLKSTVADMKNIGGKWGGAITAAKFLQRFVGKTPWIHLDIAGPSWADSDSSTRDAGGTGCFVRTLIDLIEASVPREES
jgi:leucyl aminopeptidase